MCAGRNTRKKINIMKESEFYKEMQTIPAGEGLYKFLKKKKLLKIFYYHLKKYTRPKGFLEELEISGNLDCESPIWYAFPHKDSSDLPPDIRWGMISSEHTKEIRQSWN